MTYHNLFTIIDKFHYLEIILNVDKGMERCEGPRLASRCLPRVHETRFTRWKTKPCSTKATITRITAG